LSYRYSKKTKQESENEITLIETKDRKNIKKNKIYKNIGFRDGNTSV
jgi:hypothetical protein